MLYCLQWGLHSLGTLAWNKTEVKKSPPSETCSLRKSLVFSAEVTQRESCGVWDANTAESASTKTKANLNWSAFETTNIPGRAQLAQLHMSSQPPEHGPVAPEKKLAKPVCAGRTPWVLGAALQQARRDTSTTELLLGSETFKSLSQRKRSQTIKLLYTPHPQTGRRAWDINI